MERGLEIEAGVAIGDAVAGDNRVSHRTLPAGREPTLLHTGHPSTLIAATASLLNWGWSSTSLIRAKNQTM